MPLKKIIKHDFNTQILVWELTESKEDFMNLLSLDKKAIHKLEKKSIKKMFEYFGKLACLRAVGIQDEVLYKSNGKPYLLNSNKFISISHSNIYVCLAISDKEIGIDIQLENPEKIKNIQSKFINQSEQLWLINYKDISNYLHLIWGIKESMYKLFEGKFWNFLKYYYVSEFKIQNNTKIDCYLTDDPLKIKLNAYFDRFDEYYLTWVLKEN